MRILLTTDTVGGVWTFTQRLTVSLLAEHELTLVSFGRTPSREQQDWADAMQAQGAFAFHASDAPLEWMPDNQHAYSDGAELLEDIAGDFQPDVLHLNQFCFGALARRGALDVRRVITAHSDVLSWAGACRPEPLADSDWLRTYVRLTTQGLCNVNAVVAPTQWMLDALQAHFPLRGRCAVIANGTEIPLPANAGSARKLRAVTAGRLRDEGKGLAVLGQISPAMPVLVAGEKDFGQAAAQMPAGVEALGPLPWQTLIELFAESSVYVCTSLYEPFGLAPLEAALAGCALLLRDLPSLREIWGDAAVYFRNAAGLERELARFSLDSAWLERHRALATERARHFPASRMADEYVRLYRELDSNWREKNAHAAG